MLRESTKAEIAARNRKVAELHATPHRVNHIQAILMDLSEGGTGLHEASAKKKAQAIEQYLATRLKT